jgi:hypothetical protein
MKFDERNQHFILNPHFFISTATVVKFVLPIAFFLAYLVPLDVDVTGNITANICEVWSELKIWERDKPKKKMESVGQTLPQLPWK